MARSRDDDPSLTLLSKADRILAVLPENGASITNRRVAELIRERFGTPLSDDEYRIARDHMVGLGRIVCRRGRGGLVQRTQPVENLDEEVSVTNWCIEEQLYGPVRRYLRLGFLRDPQIAMDAEAFVSITGNRRPTGGGRWAIPDLVMLTRRRLTLLRQESPEVTTFEVKTERGIDELAPQQALSQTTGANRGFVVWHCADETRRRQLLRKLLPICDRTGIGLIVTSNPSEMSTYRVERPGRTQSVDPGAVDTLLKRCIVGADRTELQTWLSGSGNLP